MKTISEQIQFVKETLTQKQKEAWSLDTEQGDADSLRYERLIVDLNDLAHQSEREDRIVNDLRDNFDFSIIGAGNGKSKIKLNNLLHLNKIKETLEIKSDNAWKLDTEEKDKEAISIDKAISKISEAITSIERTQRALINFNQNLKSADLESLSIVQDNNKKEITIQPTF